MYMYRYMLFDNYHIPRDNLLNKSADVTPQGDYETPYKVMPIVHVHMLCVHVTMHVLIWYILYLISNELKYTLSFLMGILL